jgi:hypothetical protein
MKRPEKLAHAVLFVVVFGTYALFFGIGFWLPIMYGILSWHGLAGFLFIGAAAFGIISFFREEVDAGKLSRRLDAFLAGSRCVHIFSDSCVCCRTRARLAAQALSQPPELSGFERPYTHIGRGIEKPHRSAYFITKADMDKRRAALKGYRF